MKRRFFFALFSLVCISVSVQSDGLIAVEENRVIEKKYDLVVLSQGLKPSWTEKTAIPAKLAEDGFMELADLKLRPSLTSTEGVFVAGVAAGPKDIPESIIEAGSAAMEAAMHLKNRIKHPAVSI